MCLQLGPTKYQLWLKGLCASVFELLSLAMEHPPIHLTMMLFNGERIGTIAVAPSSNGGDLVEVIAKAIGRVSELVHISIKGNQVDPGMALGDENIVTGDVVTITHLIHPLDHDGARKCDSCQFQRFCHFGYSGDVAVIALCEPCGGHVGCDVAVLSSAESS